MTERRARAALTQKWRNPFVIMNCVLLLFGLLWTHRTVQQSDTAAEFVAHSLLLDRQFGTNELQTFHDHSAAVPGARAAAASAIISLSLLETKVKADAGPLLVASGVDTAEREIVALLKQSPQQGYFWFALYALRSSLDHGASALNLPLLDMSYQLAPFDGWIAARRSPIVMARLETLSPDLKTKARLEFFTLLNQGLRVVVREVFWNAKQDLRLEIIKAIEALPGLKRDRLLHAISDPNLNQ